MTHDWSALKTMPGSKVLALLRDVLLNERARVESLERQMIAIGLTARKDLGRHAVELALGAAADIVTFVLAAGEELAIERASKPPKWVETDADRSRWQRDLDRKQRIFVDIANQARAALMADGLAKHDEEAGGEDGSAN